MRYTESREQSANVLRMAVAEMGRHEAAFNPFTFAVWYEHLAGMNPPLSAALQARMAQTAGLDSDAVAELYRAHVVDIDAEQAARISGDFRRVMHDMAQASSRTGETARSFGEQLAGLEDALTGARADEPLAPRVSRTLRDTREMQQSVDSLRQEVTRSEQHIEQLRNELDRSRIEVITDPLTRVLNRRGFDQALERLLTQAAPPSASHGLILIDIDHFKRINDGHGHLTGDAVLEAIGGVLKRIAEKAPHETACARYGGEEFALLLESAALADALQLAHAVCAAVRNLKVHNRRTGVVVEGITVSAGVALWQPGDAATNWIAGADRALYRSKEAGRDRVSVA